MQHPGKNALGSDLIGWLDEEITRAGDQPILLTGTGDAFSAGLNLREVAGHDLAGMEGMLRRLDRMYARLFLHPAPTVAYVNGHAIAGGCILMLLCDWRVGASDTEGDAPRSRIRIGINEAALGACMPPVTLNLVRARLSPHVLDRIVLGAQLHSPADALALGMLDEVTSDPLAARKRLEMLSAHPREAYAATKRALRSGMTAVSAEDERRFREVELPLWTSKAMKARLAAVLDRK